MTRFHWSEFRTLNGDNPGRPAGVDVPGSEFEGVYTITIAPKRPVSAVAFAVAWRLQYGRGAGGFVDGNLSEGELRNNLVLASATKTLHPVSPLGVTICARGDVTLQLVCLQAPALAGLTQDYVIAAYPGAPASSHIPLFIEAGASNKPTILPAFARYLLPAYDNSVPGAELEFRGAGTSLYPLVNTRDKVPVPPDATEVIGTTSACWATCEIWS